MTGYKLGSMNSTLAPRSLPPSIDATLDLLASADYLADRSLATVLFLALKMSRPLFLEGEAGVGKTEIAKVLSSTLGRRLIRLQCYEGLDVSTAVYEWNYAAQMIAIRVAEAEGSHDRERLEHDVFSERFLIKRPLLQALEPDPAGAPVLLIDELDRADEAFEAFLLEVLADFQVTIPELGTVKTDHPPIVIITSNRTREFRAGPAEGGSVQGARCRRDARLGIGARRARRGCARSGDRFRHARRAAQVSGRHRPPRGQQGKRTDRRGARGAQSGGVGERAAFFIRGADEASLAG